jgi:hypothetical protein
MAIQRGPKIVTNGLVLCLDAADKNSYPGTGVSWSNLTSNSNNGTLVNGPTFNNNNRGSIVFDGLDDYVDCTTLDTSVFTTEASLICWLRCDVSVPVVATQTGIFGFENTIARSHYVWTDGFAYIGAFRSNRVDSITLSSVNRTLPHMLTITTKGGGLWKLYQNQILVTSVAAEASISIDAGTRYIATKSPADNYEFKGGFYNFSLYNRELSSFEIAQNYNAIKDRFGL